MDFTEETATTYREHRYQFREVDIILLEGIFLLKKSQRHHFDLACWVDCSFATALARAVKRCREALPPLETVRVFSHHLFFRTAHPLRARRAAVERGPDDPERDEMTDAIAPFGDPSILLSKTITAGLMTTMSLQPGGLGGGIEKQMAAPASSTKSDNNPERWVDEHGDVLYRYALARVRKPEIAQDLVQETFSPRSEVTSASLVNLLYAVGSAAF